MRKTLLCLILFVVPAQLMAFSTKDFLSLVAMPLAVAAVSDVNAVPQDQLTDIVSALNQANVPPAQFVEVVRYVPVTYVQPVPSQPTFADFVRTQSSSGLTGNALVNAIVDQLRNNYAVTPQLAFNEPATTFVVQRDYIPVVTSSDPLTLVALPLAVAAVADVTGIPQNNLADLVSTLNNANVPVTQEIQVIRYAPVALVSDNGQPFVEFVQTQVTRGVIGPALVPVVVERLQTFYPQPQPIVMNTPAPQPQPAFIDRDFVPRTAVTRVEELHGNPHGGPPGQIKRELGLQTGAEVVHGDKRGRQFIPAPVPVQTLPPPMVSSGRAENEQGRGHGESHGKGHKDNVQFVAPPPAAQPPVVVQPAPAPAPMAVPRDNAGKGHGGEEHGHGGDKGHGKDH